MNNRLLTSAELSRRTFLKRSATAAAALTATLATSPALAADESPVIEIGSRRELFIDNYLIERLNGKAQQRLHHPIPREIAIVHDEPWEGTSCGYHTVFQDGDLYRMYYRGSQLTVKDGKLFANVHPEFYCYAESRDGIHWDKPDLELFEYEGSKKNNIIWHGVGTHNFSPLRDTRPDCPDAERYKALGGTRREGGLFAFVSADGIHWKLFRDKPVISNGAFDSQNLAFWDEVVGKYRAYWRIFTKGITTEKVWKPAGYRAIRTATSTDFLKWTDEADLTYEDSPQEHLYTNQVKPYHRAPQILIGFPMRYVERGWNPSMRALPELAHRKMRAEANERYGTGITEALLMASRDGVHFKRWNEGFLRPGIQRLDTWNYSHMSTAWHAVETASDLRGAPNELSFYSKESGWTGTSCAYRRYALRLDGFVSIQAPMSGGELITRPITFTGDQLRLNFATSAAGAIRVELQRPDGAPIPGFALDDCHEVFGDTIDRTVAWKGVASLADLNGKPLRLRFALNDANLYSFRFAAE
ncbi:MAG: hypothetical protein CMJ64_14695 [Planctomycetaceae bacterium]|nr:hypothetical protein [Planctomycetaceae bacterium]